MHHVLYLANGRQTRFGPRAEPKQLLGIFGVPLIVSTMMKFAGRVDRQIVVTGNPVIQDAVDDNSWPDTGSPSWVNVGPTAGLRATVLASRAQWGSTRTTYLFGDCYYTPAAVEVIAGCRLPYAHIARTHASAVTGKPYGESFALTWQADQDARVAEVLARKPEGTSWEFYKTMAGLDELPAGVNYLEQSPPCLIRVDDFTDDFDTWEDYHRWFERYLASPRPEARRA